METMNRRESVPSPFTRLLIHRRPFLFTIFILYLIMAAASLVFVFFKSAGLDWYWESVRSLSIACPQNFAFEADFKKAESCSAIIRNFGLTIGVGLSFIGVTCGLLIAWWGRWIQDKQWRTQHESHLQERFEKAADRLDSKTEWARIVACRSLVNLAKTDKSMKSRCVRLLFAFINNLLEYDKREVYPFDSPLNTDIREAIASFSAIYEHYDINGIDNEEIKLPNYFWINRKKGKISLIRANLRDANLQGASLEYANLRRSDLQGAKLQAANLHGANLRRANLGRGYLIAVRLAEADLHDADLEKANISLADMNKAKNLTKEQILSAIWGYDIDMQAGTPDLPEGLMQDDDVKKWLETPAYDCREKPKKTKTKAKAKPKAKPKAKAKSKAKAKKARGRPRKKTP